LPEELRNMLEADEFTRFEHEGWQRVARKYENAWSGLTLGFIPHLLKAASVRSGQQILDVACGPGYVSELARAQGAKLVGVDFSGEMVRIARERNPEIDFREGDAQDLNFDDASFDCVVMNFGLLHLSRPEAAFAEARRVLRPGGRYAFTVWAGPEESPGARLVEDAVKTYANMDVQLPPGPDYFAYGNENVCRQALAATGFDSKSLSFETITVKWQVPSASHLFEAECHAGVRTASLLAKQTPRTLEKIKDQIEQSVGSYAQGNGFAIPFAAHAIAISR
jgi:ubiquinone/menaquinone biosynthesis C-methylase UbiE